MLIAPVYEKNAVTRTLYLPKGDWYDWWTNTKQPGRQTIIRPVDLATMPIYVRAGAIIPFDAVRQYTSEVVSEPTTLKIYTGANGSYTLYEDDGITQDYLEGKAAWTHIVWNDKLKELTIAPQAAKHLVTQFDKRIFRIELIPGGITKDVSYPGKLIKILF